MHRLLPAAGGLTLSFDEPHWRVEWGEPDWLGPVELAAGGAALSPSPGRLGDGADDLGGYLRAEVEGLPAPLRASVRAYREAPVFIFRLEAERATSLDGSSFAEPSVAWPALRPARRRAGGLPAGARTYGHQYSEFALPVNGGDAATGFLFAPHRPPVVMPLLFVAPDGRTLLLGPLDAFHEQVIAVPADREHEAAGVRCGWHGDLAEVPEGFSTEIALWAAPSPRRALEAWAALLRRRHGTAPPSRYADDFLAKLSYWSDNGAVYYYRTAPGCDYTTTLERAVTTLRESGVPVHGVQIDSWFYPHQNLREVGPEGAPLVPPSGMMTWEPRADLFPAGFGDLQSRLGGAPLAFHSRHFSRHSPYFEHYEGWVDGDYAHPSDEGLFTRLMEQAASWGAVTYEQDWLVESFLGVRGLRAAPGRARAWQEALDRTAGRAGLTLQWCMATPADFLQAISLRRVTSIRTSGDYRYLFDNGLNWVWFLHTNALARALGLNPYKDVFLSHGKTEHSDGEPYAEIEALLAALSAGPVGIGDEIGRTDRELVLRTCREDGVLIKPDVPIAAIDRCFLRNAFLEPEALVGEAYSEHPAGRWTYVAAFNACRAKQEIRHRVSLAELAEARPSGEVLAFDWRARRAERLAAGGGWEEALGWQDWSYRILCPLARGEITVVGDVGKYATAGDRRLAAIRATAAGLAFDVLGVAGTSVEVCGWSARKPTAMKAWTPAGAAALEEGSAWTWDRDGLWRLRVQMGAAVAVSVEVTAG